MYQRCFILSEKKEFESDVQNLLELCHQLSTQTNTCFVYTKAEQTKEHNYAYFFNSLNTEECIRMVEDLCIPTRYIEVYVEDPAVFTELETLVCQNFSIKSNETLIQELKENIDSYEHELVIALSNVGIGYSEGYEEDVFTFISTAINAPSIDVRRSAVLAIFLLKWREFSNVLENAIAVEDNEDLSTRMSYALSLCMAT